MQQKAFNRSLALMAFGAALAITPAGPIAAAGSGWFYSDRDYSDVRDVVDRTQNDLRSAIDLEHGGHQRNRYKNVQDHLSDFDRSLAKGHFNKDRLDSAINDLQHLLDHNTLQTTVRDALLRDVSDLRAVREHH